MSKGRLWSQVPSPGVHKGEGKMAHGSVLEFKEPRNLSQRWQGFSMQLDSHPVVNLNLELLEKDHKPFSS